MLPGKETDSGDYHCKPDNSRDNYIGFSETDNLLDAAVLLEKKQMRDVSVLLSMPDDQQRLVTFQVPPDKDFIDIIQELPISFNKNLELHLNVFEVNDPLSDLDYIFEIDQLFESENDDISNNCKSILWVDDFLQIFNSFESNNKFEVNNQTEMPLTFLKDNSNSSASVFKEHPFDFYNEGEQELSIGFPEVVIDSSIERELVLEPELESEVINIPNTDTFNLDLQMSDHIESSEMEIELNDSPLLKNPLASNVILTIYPPPPKKGGISINAEDYRCLGENQFLNDVIIDFYLRYLLEEVLNPIDKNRTYIFSSHFFTRLANPQIEVMDDSITDIIVQSKHRYVGVQRWTKNVNIFEKDFLIIPINQHAHWFLVIICFPNLVGNSESFHDLSNSFEIENDKPYILIFDSLYGNRKKDVSTIIQGYLYHEYLSKMNVENAVWTIQTVNLKVPKQTNVTDCGLYLLQYVESFFKKPIQKFTLPFKNLKNWFEPNVIVRKRKEISKLITKLSIDYNAGKTIEFPVLKFPLEIIECNNEEHLDSSPLSKQSMQFINSPKRKSVSTKRNNTLIDFQPKALHSKPKSKSINLETNKFGNTQTRSYSPLTINRSVTSRPINRKRYSRLNSVHSRSKMLVNLAQSTFEHKQKSIADRTKLSSSKPGLSSKEINPRESITNYLEDLKPKESLFSSCLSTDKFYSIEALKNDIPIPPTTSFSKYLKFKKKFEVAKENTSI